MKLKKILSSLAACAIIIGFSSCSKDDDNGINHGNVTLKGVNGEETTGISVKADATSASFSVYTPVTPNVTSSESWITAKASEPSKMNNISLISLTIEPNPTDAERSANLNISAAGSTITVKVTQAPGEGKPVEPEPPVEEEDQPLLGYKAKDIANNIGQGWNIGNTLEATGGETSWGNPKINESYVAGIKAAGFNAVRIPCAWDHYVIDNQNTIDPAWLDRVNEVVKYVTDQDMYAIVNIHWDGGWLENNIGTSSTEALLNKQKSFWTQIATRLGHYNEKLMFAGLNEPNAGNEWGSASENREAMKSLLDYEQAFVDAVRATGGNNSTRTLIMQAPNTSINMAYDLMDELPTDPAGDGYMMVEVHYYDPSDYTIMEKDGAWSTYLKFFWGSQFHQGGNRDCNWGEEDSMLSQFQKMQTKFVDKGYPVVLGEYGAYPEDHYNGSSDKFSDEEKEIIKASRKYWYECLKKYTDQTGILPFVWDTGELISRTNGNVKEGKQYILDAILGNGD